MLGGCWQSTINTKVKKKQERSTCSQDTLPETNSSPLKMDGWKMNFLLGWPNFRGEMLVSGRVNESMRVAESPGGHHVRPLVVGKLLSSLGPGLFSGGYVSYLLC